MIRRIALTVLCYYVAGCNFYHPFEGERSCVDVVAAHSVFWLRIKEFSKSVVPKLWAAAPKGAAASSQGSRELLQFLTFFLFFIILFKVADVNILQSALDIMCCVNDSFGTRLHAVR